MKLFGNFSKWTCRCDYVPSPNRISATLKYIPAASAMMSAHPGPRSTRPSHTRSVYAEQCGAGQGRLDALHVLSEGIHASPEMGLTYTTVSGVLNPSLTGNVGNTAAPLKACLAEFLHFSPFDWCNFSLLFFHCLKQKIKIKNFLCISAEVNNLCLHEVFITCREQQESAGGICFFLKECSKNSSFLRTTENWPFRKRFSKEWKSGLF